MIVVLFVRINSDVFFKDRFYISALMEEKTSVLFMPMATWQGGGDALGHFHLIEYLADDFFCCDVACLCLVGESYAMTHDILSYGSHVFGDDIAAVFDEGIRTGRESKIDGGTW